MSAVLASAKTNPKLMGQSAVLNLSALVEYRVPQLETLSQPKARQALAQDAERRHGLFAKTIAGDA